MQSINKDNFTFKGHECGYVGEIYWLTFEQQEGDCGFRNECYAKVSSLSLLHDKYTVLL